MIGARRPMIAAALALLGGCGGDPDEKARAELDAIRTSWTEAQDITDLDRRLDTYNEIIDRVERVGTRYQDTDVGARIASGQRALGVEPSTYRATRDDLASKSSCIKTPTASCLQPFARDPGLNLGVQERAPDIRAARQAACRGDFDAVRAELEAARPNPTVYGEKLLQTAFGAETCGRNDIVDRIIEEAVNTNNAVGSRRVDHLTTIISTIEFFAGWRHGAGALDELARSGTLGDNGSASAALTAGLAYARIGDTEAALSAYDFVTDDLGFGVNQADLTQLAAAFIAHGDTDEIARLDRYSVDERGLQLALNVIAKNAGLHKVKPNFGGARTYAYLMLNTHSPLDEMFAPPTDNAEREALRIRLDRFSALLDQTVDGLSASNRYLATQYAPLYGLSATIRQKLGQPELANEALDKGVAVAASDAARRDVSLHAALVEAARGDLDTAIDHIEAAKSLPPWGLDIPGQMLRALGAEGRTDDGISAAARIETVRPGFENESYRSLGEGLVDQGHLADAERVLTILFASARGQQIGADLALRLVEEAAAKGERTQLSSLEAIMVDDTDRSTRVQFLSAQAKGFAAGGAERDAEEVLRELFIFGQEADQTSNRAPGDYSVGNPRRSYLAQSAAIAAMEAGQVDLGLEFYQAATWKDTTPLVKAAEAASDRRTLSAVLATAYSEGELAFAHTAWGGVRNLTRLDATAAASQTRAKGD
ncbi:MAG: hypothetical protein AAF608_12065 [Pseudomonadota bacterium]